jgi:hypothetical protein
VSGQAIPPRLGDRVHYVAEGSPLRDDGTQKYSSVCRAADVTEVDPASPHRVGLCVLNPLGIFFRPLEHGGSELGHAGGQWHHRH